MKQALFRELETVVSGVRLLASNTSSLSITAIAAGCADPSRVVGYHFFNPVPLMKVVEVIDGLRSDPAAGDALMDLARRMGHTPVRAKDMPGFIVNHAGRGMNTEGLRVAGEGVASFADIDRIMREQAGFRLGPFELLDLTALDVSHPVMESIYHQFYEEPRFTPSPITGTRLAGGLIGRKSGEGFYRYVDGKQQVAAEAPAPHRDCRDSVWVSARYPRAREAVRATASRKAGVKLDDGAAPAADSLIVVTPFGHDATTAAVDEALDASRVVAIDALFPLVGAQRRTLMTTPATTRACTRRGACAVRRRRRARHRDPRLHRLRRATRGGDDRQHRLRYRAKADRHAGRHRSRRDARPRLPARAARAWRRARRDDHPHDPAQYVRACSATRATVRRPGSRGARNSACR